MRFLVATSILCVMSCRAPGCGKNSPKTLVKLFFLNDIIHVKLSRKIFTILTFDFCRPIGIMSSYLSRFVLELDTFHFSAPSSVGPCHCCAFVLFGCSCNCYLKKEHVDEILYQISLVIYCIS